MGAGYRHYLMPYRGADENVSYDFVSMIIFIAQRQDQLVAGWPFSEMMNEKGYFAGFLLQNGPISTFELIGFIFSK